MKNKNGIGFVGLLQIAFIILKLCNVINWNWLLVLSPMLISLALSVIVIILYLIFGR